MTEHEWRAPLPPEEKAKLETARRVITTNVEETHMNEHDTPMTDSVPTTPIAGTLRAVVPSSITGVMRGRLWPEYFTAAGTTRANKFVPATLYLDPKELTNHDKFVLWPDVYTTSGRVRVPPEQLRAVKAATCAKMRARKAALHAADKAKRKVTKVGKRVTRRTPRRLTRPLPDGTTALQNAQRDVHAAAVRVLDADLALHAATQRAQHDLRAIATYLRGLAERLHTPGTKYFADDTYYAIQFWAKYADDCAANFRSNTVELINEGLNDEIEAS